MSEGDADIKQRPGLDPGLDPAKETQHPGYQPGRHEQDSMAVSGRLDHTRTRDTAAAHQHDKHVRAVGEGGEASLHKISTRVDDYAHEGRR